MPETPVTPESQQNKSVFQENFPSPSIGASLSLNQRHEAIRKKISLFFRDRENQIFLAILLFSLVLLLFFFFLTKDQPLWWDEAEYMSHAKNFAFGLQYQVNPQRPLLFPALAALFFKLGFNEVWVRIFLVLLPAWLTTLVSYLFIKEAFDKKTAAIASIIIATSWIGLFYAMRLMTDAIGFFLGMASFYCFWKGYINKGKRVYTLLIGFFVGLSFLIRLTGVFYGAVIFLFLLLTDKFRFIKSKDLWISVLIGLLTISPLFIYDYFFFQNPLAFRSGYTGPAQGAGPGWDLLTFVYDYPLQVFFITFIVGLATLLPILASLDIIFKKEEKKYYGDLFLLLNLIAILFFFVFFMRLSENRWMISMSISIFTFSAKGIFFLGTIVRRYSRHLSILLVIALVVAGAYLELRQANASIQRSRNSYAEIKDAGLWMKANSNPEDVLFSVSLPQVIYYSERKTYSYSAIPLNGSYQVPGEEQFFVYLKEKKPKYLMISLIEPHHPPWILQQVMYQEGSQGILLPLMNSSIRVMQNQITSIDLKPSIEKEGVVFNFVYPQQALNGVFIYRMEYG